MKQEKGSQPTGICIPHHIYWLGNQGRDYFGPPGSEVIIRPGNNWQTFSGIFSRETKGPNGPCRQNAALEIR